MPKTKANQLFIINKELRLGSYEIGHVKTKGGYFVSCCRARLGRPAVGLAGLQGDRAFPALAAVRPSWAQGEHGREWS